MRLTVPAAGLAVLLAACAPLVQALVPMPDAARDVLVALAPVGA